MVGTDQASREMRVLDFRLCNRHFALGLEWVQEILPMAWLESMPGSPSILEGFLNLRGTALPVLRLDRLFGFQDFAPGLQTVILVLKGPGHSLGVMADETGGILAVPANSLLPIRDGHNLNDCVQAGVEAGGRFIHLLSPDRILLKLESERIAGLRTLEQKRLRDLDGRGSADG